MRILVTGSEGFLGRHLMEQGRAWGYTMTGCDIMGTPDKLQSAKDVDVKGFDRVIHAAGLLGTSELISCPQTAVQANVLETLAILANCLHANVPFTYITLGNNWLNPYSITKNCAADMVRMYREVLGAHTQVAICYNLFGPYQKWAPVRKIVPEFMTRIIAGLPVQLNDSGLQHVDMVYAPDVAREILRHTDAVDYHCGSGVARTVAQVAGDCAMALGAKLRTESLPPRKGETGPAAIAPHGLDYATDYTVAMKVTADWYLQHFTVDA